MAVTHSSDLNPPTDPVDAIDEFEANGATMAGMTVRATFFNNDTFEEFVETVAWVATGATSGGVVGTNWSLSVSSDTFTGSWSFTINFVSGIGQLTELYFDGAPGGVIFDRTFGNADGTAGSELGRDFVVMSGAAGGDIHVTYSVPVSIGGAEPVGDLFRRMTVAFEVDGLGPTGPATNWSFRQDTDQQLDLPSAPVLSVTRGWGVNRHVLTVRMVQAPTP